MRLFKKILIIKSFLNFLVHSAIIFQNETSSPCALPNYCLNNGTCVDETVKLYACLCKPGFTGNRCELEINDCYITNHNDTTKSLVFTGRNYSDTTISPVEFSIEKVVDSVLGVLQNLNDSADIFDTKTPLEQNNLSSIRNLDGFETSISVPVCENGAQCVDKQNGFECRCAPGFVGETCQIGK